MKSMNIRKVGSILAGTAVIGAALSAPVLASMDNTGITKGFFYDANYNPVAQIVVGEKGMASDAVAAGNIAATIGNLAYMTKTVTGSGSGATAEGQVVITTAARGAVGDYVQDTDAGGQILEEFYEKSEGFVFSGDKTYEQGDFTSYTLSCDKQTRNEAGVLMSGSYKNIHCLFCHNLCLESLENPAHDMKEQITVDSSVIRYYEEGVGVDDSESLRMAIGKDAISYTVQTDCIPVETIYDDTENDDNFIDFEYRGKMMLFGTEYYVKDIDGDDKITLATGKVLDDVTSEGFTAEYKGYKFKVDHLIYAAEYQVAGILLDVQKPDGTIVQTQISKMANGVVDDVEIAGVYAEEAAALQTASLIAYDLTTQVVLENGEDLTMGGKTYEDWDVDLTTVEMDDDGNLDCDQEEYENAASGSTFLDNVNITYNHALDNDEALEKDESLMFPNMFKLTFKGYLDSNFNEAPNSGAGEGDILLERGDEAYQIKVSFTGDDSNRYNNVRLDNGPFARNDQFIIGGELFKFESYTKDEQDEDLDTYTVKIKPMIKGSTVTFEDMQKFCDDDNVNASVTRAVCSDEDIELRELALVKAMDEDDFDQDDNYAIDPDQLWIAEGQSVSGQTVDVLFASQKLIFLQPGFVDAYTNVTGNITDYQLLVSEDVSGDESFDDFKVDGYDIEMYLDTTEGVDPTGNFLNFKTTVNFVVADGTVAVNMYDRGFTDDDTSYDNDMTFYNAFDAADLNVTNTVLVFDEDTDTMLIVPEGGDRFIVDYGSDDRIDSVTVQHPQVDVDSTYFIGTAEEETVSESTITKADEGKEITAGCCSFTVSKFEVNVGNASSDSVTTQVVNPVVGSVVVPESAADATKNLIIVGGPAVNAMTTVTADQISAQTDKYIVKKDGNKLIVAGWTADDTVAAGNSLIAWLKANAH